MIALDNFGGNSVNIVNFDQDIFEKYSGEAIQSNKLCDYINDFMNDKTYLDPIRVHEINPLQNVDNVNAFNNGSFKKVVLYLNENVKAINMFNDAYVENLYIKGGTLSDVGNNISFKNLYIICNEMHDCFNEISLTNTDKSFMKIICKNMVNCFDKNTLYNFDNIDINAERLEECFNSCYFFNCEANYNIRSAYNGLNSLLCMQQNNNILKYNGIYASNVLTNPSIYNAEINIINGNKFMYYGQRYQNMKFTLGGKCSSAFCGNDVGMIAGQVHFDIKIRETNNSFCCCDLNGVIMKIKADNATLGYSMFNNCNFQYWYIARFCSESYALSNLTCFTNTYGTIKANITTYLG